MATVRRPREGKVVGYSARFIPSHKIRYGGGDDDPENPSMSSVSKPRIGAFIEMQPDRSGEHHTASCRCAEMTLDMHRLQQMGVSTVDELTDEQLDEQRMVVLNSLMTMHPVNSMRRYMELRKKIVTDGGRSKTITVRCELLEE